MTLEELKNQIKEILMPIVVDEIGKLSEEISTANANNQAEIVKQLEEERAKRQEVMDAYQKALDEIASSSEKAKMLDEEAAKESEIHGFKSLAHFCYDIVKAGPNGRDASETLNKWNSHVKATMNATDLEEGASLIPTEFSRMLLERQKAVNTVLQNAMIVPMGTNKIDIPYMEGFDESQGKVMGNVAWFWTGEEKQYTASNFETGAVPLVLNKLTGMAKVTNELIKWSPQAIEPLVNRAFDKGLNFAINKAVIRGTGAGMPLGVLNSSAKLEIAKASGQAADTFIYDNVLDMIARLYSQDEGIGDGFWYMNKTVLPQLGKLSVEVGLGGSGIFLQNSQIQGRPEFTLMGIPIRFSPMMPILGDAGDVGLFDWSQYLIGQPVGGGVEAAQSIHLYFDYGATAFRFTTYMDARPWWPTELTPYLGDSQAPFVTLAARA